MKKIIIIKAGDTFPAMAKKLGDFEDWIATGLCVNKEDVRVVDVPKGDKLPRVETCKSVVISGSHASVTENLSWSVVIEQWVPQLIRSDIPLLGICYGHQLIAKSMGGVVDFHTSGIEIGTTDIEMLDDKTPDPLFKNIPHSFKAHVCHSQTVTKLPDQAVRIAENSFEPNYAFRIGQSAWGVQFHPEFDDKIMAAYAENMKTSINASGLILSETLDKIESTPIPVKILGRFGKLAK